MFIQETTEKIKTMESLTSALQNRQVDITPAMKINQLRVSPASKEGLASLEFPLANLGETRFGALPMNRIAFGHLMQEIHFPADFIEECQSREIESIWKTVSQAMEKSDQEVRLVLAKNPNATYIKGVVSPSYKLVRDVDVVNQFIKNMPPELEFSDAIISPEMSEFRFLSQRKERTIQDPGSPIQSGITVINSEGTKARSMIIALWLLRQICTNGMMGLSDMFSRNHIHRGTWEPFGSGEIEGLMSLVETIGPRINQLFRMSLTDKIGEYIKKEAEKVVGKKVIETTYDPASQKWVHVSDPWNFITNAANRFNDNKRRMGLQALGMHIIEKFTN